MISAKRYRLGIVPRFHFNEGVKTFGAVFGLLLIKSRSAFAPETPPGTRRAVAPPPLPTSTEESGIIASDQNAMINIIKCIEREGENRF